MHFSVAHPRKTLTRGKVNLTVGSMVDMISTLLSMYHKRVFTRRVPTRHSKREELETHSSLKSLLE